MGKGNLLSSSRVFSPFLSLFLPVCDLCVPRGAGLIGSKHPKVYVDHVSLTLECLCLSSVHVRREKLHPRPVSPPKSRVYSGSDLPVRSLFMS